MVETLVKENAEYSRETLILTITWILASSYEHLEHAEWLSNDKKSRVIVIMFLFC